MKLYLIDKNSKNKTKLMNLGGKIAFEKLNKLIDAGQTILIRRISEESGSQSDFRIRKVPQEMKTDRGYKTIRAYYLVNLEFGRAGFENFVPKEVSYEQTLRFRSLDRAINMLESKQKLPRADWVIG